MKKLIGGPLEGVAVSPNSEDNSWVTGYTLDGRHWIPRQGVFVWDFPDGVMNHGYRKQKDGQFHHVWSRPSGNKR
jgi:hypothetical protein